MESIARLRFHQASPQKVRLVVDLIRGMNVEEAAVVLRTTKKAAAKPIEKLLKSAVANAENRDQNVDVGKLYVKEAFVDGGPTLKRIQANTMGRAFRILKRQSHVTLKLATRTASAAAGGPNAAAKTASKNAGKPASKAPAKSQKAAKRNAKGGK
jgi:large subunit ribosomal protein L22